MEPSSRGSPSEDYVAAGPSGMHRSNVPPPGHGQPEPAGRRGQGYRKLWQKVSQVNPGDSAVIVSDCTVEDMLRTIKALSPRDSAVAAVRAGIAYLDSRALAFLFKELGKCKLTHRAIEIFDWLHTQTDPDLVNLCDVFTYTTIISLCGSPRLLWKALRLVGSMKAKGIAVNTHTCSALMSVCVKAKQAGLALDVYDEMRRDGLKPSVVTYNTLIDAYGKLGLWTEAVQVLDSMESQGIKPEARTYNSVVRACNESMQPDEAYSVYTRMLKVGEKPTAATFTPTINAYCEQARVLEAVNVFNEMVASGCERTTATYGALLDVCEKSGQPQLMMQLLERLQQDGFTPEQVRIARVSALADKHAGERQALGRRGGNSQQQQRHTYQPGPPSQLSSAHVARSLGITMNPLSGLSAPQVTAPIGPSGFVGGSQYPPLDIALQAPPQAMQGGWDEQPGYSDFAAAASAARGTAGKRLVFYNGQLVHLQ